MFDDQKENLILLSWFAPEFVKHEKSAPWFWVLGIMSLAMIIISLIMKNFLFVLIVVLAAFLIYIQAKKHPRKIKIFLTEKGITIEEKNYDWKEFRSFWIFQEPEIKSLSLISKKITQPQIYIPLNEQSPEKIKEVLIKFLPEKEQEESLIDAITRRIRF